MLVVPVRDADEAMYDPKAIKYTGPGSPSCHLKRNETKEREWSRKRTPADACGRREGVGVAADAVCARQVGCTRGGEGRP